MRFNYFSLLGATALAVGLSGCVDSDYDLSDIDTTSRIPVNDLVIPVNIDPVKLGDVITYDDDSEIKAITIDGEEFFAFEDNGEFHSDPIEISKVKAAAPTLASTTKTLDQVIADQQTSATGMDGRTATYDIQEQGNKFTYDAGKVDNAITALYSAKTEPIQFKIHLDALSVTDNDVEKMYFDDIVVRLPKGLTATTSHGTYNSATGLWTIPYIEVQGSACDAQLTASAVDFRASGAAIDTSHHFVFKSEFKVLGGRLTIVSRNENVLPEQLEFRVSYSLTDMVANSICGVINYKMDGFDIAPLSLSDIPDFLDCEGTKIQLQNPQIYLQLNNPVAGSGLDVQAGLTLTAERNNAPDVALSAEAPFVVGHDLGVTGPYNYVLTPKDAKLTTPSEYAQNLSRVDFNSFGSIFMPPASSPDAGMPDRIAVTVSDPQIPSSEVTDFALGVTIPAVKGSYKVVAPLALTDQAVIIYTDTKDGWGSEDLEALTIEKLTLTATATSTAPVAVELSAWPIDKDGNTLRDVVVTSNTLEAGATDAPITITLTGTVRNLDGVKFQARVKGANGQALAPGQMITLKKVRATVGGYYERKF